MRKHATPQWLLVNQYLIADRNAEIALARSAAPKSISDQAEIQVLGEHGYETAVKGTNGFVCLVERSWTAGADAPDFWNPKVRSPFCLNAQAVETYLPLTIMKTNLALAGKSKPQIVAAIQAALEEKKLAAYRTWRDVLHDVEARLPERRRWALAPSPDVFRAVDETRSLGCKFGRLAYRCSPRHRGPDHNLHGSTVAMVRRNT